MKCLECGYMGEDIEFVFDYYFDEKLDDEVSQCRCPKCGNDDEKLLVDEN